MPRRSVLGEGTFINAEHERRAEIMLTLLSLGAGVQSSTMALMAAHGEITPMPDAAIFADTQSEPMTVYKWLDWLEAQLPFPVYRVTAGNLHQKILAATRGERRMDERPPFFVEGGGMLRRQCTSDFKLIPIHRKVRELVGLRPRQWGKKEVCVEQWIGISIDEASRMKPSRCPWILHRWPLIEKEVSRRDCLTWMQQHGYPEPTKSACTFCPFHDNATWARMRRDDPAAFANAVMVDRAIRGGAKDRKRGSLSPARWYVHRSCQPLDEVVLGDDPRQINMFENECEGMCGV